MITLMRQYPFFATSIKQPMKEPLIVQKPLKILIILIPFFLVCPAPAVEPVKKIVIDDFADGLDPHWQAKSFKGLTHYAPSRDGDHSCIKATSNQSASGLIYKAKFDAKKLPILNWSWKIDHTLTKGDARTKEGDDYAARIYVVFPSFFFWKTKTLNYIWANKLPKETAIPSSYTANSMMIAIESGPHNLGKWITEQRNIYEDYKRYFGEEPPEVGAIAIMTDTDNTGETAIACYGPIQVNADDVRNQ